MDTEKKIKKTIIITGGAGYIGSIVTKTLLQNNYRVICIDNLRYGDKGIINLYTNPNFTFKNIDITNHGLIANVLNNTPDCYAVVHLAAIVGDPACKLEPELAGNNKSHELYQFVRKIYSMLYWKIHICFNM